AGEACPGDTGLVTWLAGERIDLPPYSADSTNATHPAKAASAAAWRDWAAAGATCLSANRRSSTTWCEAGQHLLDVRGQRVFDGNYHRLVFLRCVHVHFLDEFQHAFDVL